MRKRLFAALITAGLAAGTVAVSASADDGLQKVIGAYGYVDGTTVARSHNVVAVANPTPGKFCFTLAPGIDPTTTGVVVSLDLSADTTQFGATNGPQAVAEINTNHFGPDCPNGQLGVYTAERTVTTATVNNTTVVTGEKLTSKNEQFFFVVPSATRG